MIERLGREGRASMVKPWVDVWCAASDAGGAIDFDGPADPAAVAALVDAELSDPRTEILVARDAGEDVGGDLGGDLGRPVGFVVLRRNTAVVMQHWAWLQRLMVHPDQQGRGLGGRLVLASHEVARTSGLSQLRLTARSGHGLDRFYGRLGFRVIGSHPRAVALADGTFRDEITMLIDLDS